MMVGQIGERVSRGRQDACLGAPCCGRIARFGMDGLSLQSIFDVSIPFGKDAVQEKCKDGYTLAHIPALYCILL